MAIQQRECALKVAKMVSFLLHRFYRNIRQPGVAKCSVLVGSVSEGHRKLSLSGPASSEILRLTMLQKILPTHGSGCEGFLFLGKASLKWRRKCEKRCPDLPSPGWHPVWVGRTHRRGSSHPAFGVCFVS